MTNEVASEGWLETLFDESPLAIGFSRDGVILGANPAYVRLFGHESAAELRGKSLLAQIAPSHRTRSRTSSPSERVGAVSPSSTRHADSGRTGRSSRWR